MLNGFNLAQPGGTWGGLLKVKNTGQLIEDIPMEEMAPNAETLTEITLSRSQQARVTMQEAKDIRTAYLLKYWETSNYWSLTISDSEELSWDSYLHH